jgi:hypothetical protein
MSRASGGDSVHERLVDAICEFLEAATHTVLLASGLYSAELFQRQRLYGIPTSKARHPELCAYITSVLLHLKVSFTAW